MFALPPPIFICEVPALKVRFVITVALNAAPAPSVVVIVLLPKLTVLPEVPVTTNVRADML